jgi:ankyrin repeat protein
MMSSKTAIAGAGSSSGHAMGSHGAKDPGSRIADLLSRTVSILEHRKLIPTKDMFSLAGASKALRYDVDLWDRIARLKRGQRATTSLMAAARAGNTERVRWLLKRKEADVHAQQLQFYGLLSSREAPSTALHKVVAKGHLETAEALIVEGKASLQVAAPGGTLPLHYAAKYGCAEAVPLLVKHSPSTVEAVDGKGRTPLIRAAQQPKGEAIALALLAHGANPKAVDKAGFSVLHHTCVTGHPLLFSRLIAAGVNVNAITTATTETPLLVALKNKKTALAFELLAIKNIKLDAARSGDGYEAIHVACEQGLVTVVTQLLALKVSPSKRVSIVPIGDTPLMIAAKHNQMFVVDVLLATCKAPPSSSANGLLGWMNQGAGIDLKNGKGDNALAYAVLYGNLAVVELLLAAKASLDTKNNEGHYPIHQALRWSPSSLSILAKTAGIVWHRMPGPLNETCLHVAARSYSDQRLAAMLPYALVDLEATNAEGRTPLITAAASGRAESVERLLTAGANILAKGNDGLTAGELAIKGGHRTVTAVLMDIQTAPLLRAAIESGQEDAACLLIDSKMCLELAVPLTMACGRNQPRVVEKLLLAGAPANALLSDGTPILSKACQNGFTTVVQKLLEHKADPNIRDPAGSTPMHSAVSRGKHAVIPILLRYKADKDAVDNLGRSPAELAFTITLGHERKKCIKHLLRAGISVGKFDKEWKTILSEALRRCDNYCLTPMLIKFASHDDLSHLRAVLRNNPSACWGEAWELAILELVDRGLLLGPEREELGDDAEDLVTDALLNVRSGLAGPSQDEIDDFEAENEEDEEEDDAELVVWERYDVGIKPYRSLIRWSIKARHPWKPEVWVPEADEVRDTPECFSNDEEGWRELRTQPLRDDAWERRSRLVCCFAAANKNKEPEQKKAKAGAGEA